MSEVKHGPEKPLEISCTFSKAGSAQAFSESFLSVVWPRQLKDGFKVGLHRAGLEEKGGTLNPVSWQPALVTKPPKPAPAARCSLGIVVSLESSWHCRGSWSLK